MFYSYILGEICKIQDYIDIFGNVFITIKYVACCSFNNIINTMNLQTLQPG